MTTQSPEPTDAAAGGDDHRDLLESAFDHAREGRADVLQALVDAGLPVDLTNEKGDTLLILAAYRGHLDAVNTLLAAGADPDRINGRGQTALSAATFTQDESIVRALLAAGGDPHAGAVSAVKVAEQFGLPELAKVLAGES